MIVPARTPDERKDLVHYLAYKIGTDPMRLIGQTPFEVAGVTSTSLRLMGAVLYTSYRRTSIEMMWAGERGWLTRGNLFQMWAYPFLQLGVNRVWGLIHRHNKESRQLADKLGCRVVGVASEELGEGQDAIIYEMRKRECRWIASPTRQEIAHAA